MKNIVTVFFSLILLQGCASQKPSLQYENYTDLASGLISTAKCVRDGYMTPETGALTRNYLTGILNNHSYHKDIMENEIKLNEPRINPSRGECNQLAMLALEAKNRIAAENERSRRQENIWRVIQNSGPINTNCYSIGNQTFCTSY